MSSSKRVPRSHSISPGLFHLEPSSVQLPPPSSVGSPPPSPRLEMNALEVKDLYSEYFRLENKLLSGSEEQKILEEYINSASPDDVIDKTKVIKSIADVLEDSKNTRTLQQLINEKILKKQELKPASLGCK